MTEWALWVASVALGFVIGLMIGLPLLYLTIRMIERK